MKRVTKAGAGESGGRASSGSGENGRGIDGMPDLAMRGTGEGRHADERDAVDRLPAGYSAAARHGRRTEANDGP